MDRGAWQAAIHGVTKSDMTEQLMLQHFSLFVERPQGWEWASLGSSPKSTSDRMSDFSSHLWGSVPPLSFSDCRGFS